MCVCLFLGVCVCVRVCMCWEMGEWLGVGGGAKSSFNGF